MFSNLKNFDKRRNVIVLVGNGNTTGIGQIVNLATHKFEIMKKGFVYSVLRTNNDWVRGISTIQRLTYRVPFDAIDFSNVISRVRYNEYDQMEFDEVYSPTPQPISNVFLFDEETQRKVENLIAKKREFASEIISVNDKLDRKYGIGKYHVYSDTYPLYKKYGGRFGWGKMQKELNSIEKKSLGPIRMKMEQIREDVRCLIHHNESKFKRLDIDSLRLLLDSKNIHYECRFNRHED